MKSSRIAALLVSLFAFSAQGQFQQIISSNGSLLITFREFETALDQRRPEPVTQEEKQIVLSSLPKRGQVTKLNTAAREKLAALDRVLALHQREAVYVRVVIDVPQAFLGLHGRAVLLISEPALKLLEANELQALTAHEIGHEYSWNQYEDARMTGDLATLRKLEMTCDIVAFVTLTRAGLDHSWLSSGLRKMYSFNSKRFGQALNQEAYPDIEEREARLKAIAAWAGAPSGDSARVSRRHN